MSDFVINAVQSKNPKNVQPLAPFHQANTSSTPPEHLIRIRPVMERTGKCRSAVYADIQAGTFPAPVKIGRNASAWLSSEIDGWIAERVANRNSNSGV
ncbi:helix-turn-helix transcriptional regulator [Eoetvoesiella caeni]|uniref:helix-turn-helix transcriptional regulator n=1 Tax=Eoetvoesiella caeni TaxID=645616 RepID=UPI000DE8219D|nr:AlpA family transcriptional regulator [Eoetvoesiella caeni]MCI2810409.1 AlpA family transcriptional regulator [Eoetvoesiella caeni]NYT54919.1 AlpA family transcriptional regulator [Eoetvoesiella caeni]